MRKARTVEENRMKREKATIASNQGERKEPIPMASISRRLARFKGNIGRVIYEGLVEVVDGSGCWESSTGQAGGVDAATVRDLVAQYTTRRTPGLPGEATVNILALNGLE